MSSMYTPQSLTSHLILGLVLAIGSFGSGYGLATLFPHSSSHSSCCASSSSSSSKVSSSAPPGTDGLLEDNAEEDEDGIPDGDLAAVSAGLFEQCKMVLVVRTDGVGRRMSGGDISTLCCQATIACYKALVKKNPKLVKHWERTGQAKIALKAKSEDQLDELEAIAKSLNLCARSVRYKTFPGTGMEVKDIPDGTKMVLAIGPAPVPLVNEVTGKLRLL